MSLHLTKYQHWINFYEKSARGPACNAFHYIEQISHGTFFNYNKIEQKFDY